MDVTFYHIAPAGNYLYQLACVVPAALLMDMENTGHHPNDQLFPADVCRYLAVHRSDAYATCGKRLRNRNIEYFHLALSVHAVLGTRLRKTVPHPPGTLLYNNGWTAGGIAVFMFCLFLYGHLHYKNKYRQEVTLTSEKITKPIKLVMMSDLHLGYHNRREELHRWIDLINAEQPDLVLIAGDIIDGSMRPLKEQKMYEEFQRIKAPVYACLGNHEYYSGEPGAQQFYQDAGIHLLQDSVAVIGDLCIIGRDDRTNIHRKSLGKIIAENTSLISHSSFLILLDHQPYHLEQAERQHIDFQFSGHTHHGQVWPISWITESIYECAFGPYKKGHTDYYISSGLGIWGGKFRIGTRSEYVVVTIK